MVTRRLWMKSLMFGVGLLTLMPVSFAANSDDTVYQKGGYAIDGYDTVAYFILGEAVKGKAEYSAEHKGAIWLFGSAEHRDLFLTTPSTYAPQYEGYCAYAAANGNIAKTEADQWSIVDDKLYLNYNSVIKIRWDFSKEDFIETGDQQWPNIRPGVKTGRAY